MSAQPEMPVLPPGAIRKRNVYDVIDTLKDSKKNILVRVDFNVPMNKEGEITDDSRIRGAIPTIKIILASKNNAILVSHMGRPALVQKGADDDETRKEKQELTLKPVADHLSKLLGETVLFADDCLHAQDTISQLPADGGGVCLLENLRFYKQEEKNDPEFCKKLASYADAYVNDAFGTAHRAHASTAGVTGFIDKSLCGIGCLMAKELAFLDFKQVGPNEVIAAIIGGSKVSTKLPVITGLLNSIQILVLGGGLAFTFQKARGVDIGDSLVEESMVDTAKEIIAQAERDGKKLVIPVDAICAQQFPKAPMDLADTKTFRMTPEEGIPVGWMGLDCGSQTIANIHEALKGSTKLVMNGPLGVFEVPPFDTGTRALVDVLESLTKAGTVTVVGGGDSVAALEQFGKTDVVTYVSTGGGAALELLAGDVLPGVAAISDF